MAAKRSLQIWLYLTCIAIGMAALSSGATNVGTGSVDPARRQPATNDVVLRQFNAWAVKYVHETSPHRDRMRVEGLRLARDRHTAIKNLIRNDPEKAFKFRMREATRKQLPDEIRAELETEVSGIGDFEVYCADPFPGTTIAEPIRRYVQLNGHTYRAFVYGRMSFETSKAGIPLHGIAIEDLIALDEDVLPEIDSKLNVKTGPSVPNAPTAPSWTLGKKNVIVIRVDFSDLPGDPQGYSAADVQNICDTQIAPYYLASSYGLTSLSNTVTALYRMPQTAAYYATNYATSQLFGDAEAAAGANYNLSQYDRIIVYFSSMTFLSGSQINWGGLSGVGSPQVWVNGLFNFEIVAHELGHTYGLYHANLWQVTDGDPVSGSGHTVEYRDDFDTMGGNYGNDSRTDFNPWFKSMLGWIATNQVQTITTNGTFRVNRFDTSGASGILALKVVKDSGHNYWIGYRGNFTNNPSLQGGAYVIWGYNNNRQSDLLDTATPGTSDQDAGLKVGATLVDPSANLSITIIDQGTTGHTQYLDVKVHYGTTTPAVYTQPQSTTVTSGQSALFQSQGSGIPLPGYEWQRKPAGASTWINMTNGGAYTGASAPTLTISAVTAEMNADQFQCILTNSSGSTTTAPPAVLSVIPFGVSTLAGQAGTFGSTDGVGSAARFKLPSGVAVDGLGNVFVADRNNYLIRKITPNGVVTTIAGLATISGTADGTNSAARFNQPTGICMDCDGLLYIADSFNHTIRKITPVGTNWVVTTFAGQPGMGGYSDGAATNAFFNNPVGIAIDPSTNFFVADLVNHAIRKISRLATGWTVTTAAQGSEYFSPTSVGVDRFGNVFVTDQYVIDQVLRDGTLLTIAGSGGPGSQDGVGASASFISPNGVTADALGNIYVVDRGNETIRKIGPGAVVTTIAGQPRVSGSTDGALTNATFNDPWGICTDIWGNVYVADHGNNQIRKLILGPPIPLPRLDGAIIESNTFRTVLSGSVGTNYAIQATSDLTSWATQSTLTMPRGGWTTIMSLSNGTNAVQLFRAVTTDTNLQNQ